MLSVLIPVYNTDVRHFAQQLLSEIELSGIETEILFIDDASEPAWKEMNRVTGTFRFTRYEELANNIGRSKIRNLLAEKAKYDWLLFLDGDSQLYERNYFKRYMDQATEPRRLVYGGTAYGPRPADPLKYLHWFYGSQRECISAEQRNKNRFGTFKTNNFFVHKTLFNQVKFDETVKGYGHEDTLFALDIERKGFDILHIENPLWHDGLENNTEFIHKQKNAILNLVLLYQKGQVGNEIRLIRFYNTMKKWKLLWLVKMAYLKKEEVLLNNLLSNNPKLGNLDRLKLGWFMEQLR